MEITSTVKQGSSVKFPQWSGERHYMLPFTLEKGLPAELARFKDTVSSMVNGLNILSDRECYLMIDESEVSKGCFHRRPGLHVDGFWNPGIRCHGGGHTGTPSHGPQRYEPTPSHGPAKGTHCGSGSHETILLASSHTAARAFTGIYTRDFIGDWRGGDCSEVCTNGMTEVQLQANRVYALDVFCLHESLPVLDTVRRTVVRINVPGLSC